MEKTIQSLLKQASFPAENFSLTPMPGQASLRRYFRLKLSDGQTLIVMKMPTGPSSVSEEITKTGKSFADIPFVNLQKYLISLDLPVPKIFAESKEGGILILEDLGDQMLYDALQTADEKTLLFFYKKAVELLAEMQRQTRLRPDDGCMAFHRRFDFDLLFWEFTHFVEYGIEDRLGIQIQAEDRKILDTEGRKLCEEIVQMPQGFTHRDFQSRNLMVHNQQFYLIDFQDALGGPVVYDLVSLLRDSYVDLNLDVRATVIGHYLSLLNPGEPYFNERQKLCDHCDIVTLQRKLKDTGRFQYILTVKKNPDFLVHVPSSLKYVKEAFGRLKKYEALHQMISKFLPELS